MERKLASIQVVNKLSPIEGADLIECASIQGWEVVVKKGEFKVGDKCVYFEIDSFVPANHEAFSFLEKSFVLYEGLRGARVKTIKLRKQLSQGLALPLNSFDKILHKFPEGADVTGLLNVQKWEAPEERRSNGRNDKSSRLFPSFLRKTDQERVQNSLKEMNKHSSELFEVTVKLDGSSMTVYHMNNKCKHFKDHFSFKTKRKASFVSKVVSKLKALFSPVKYVQGVCSRNIELGIEDSNHFSTYARSRVLKPLKECDKNIALQGELVGPGIQGNYEGEKELKFYVYSVFDIDAQTYFDPLLAKAITEGMGLDYVPVLSSELTLKKFIQPGELDYLTTDSIKDILQFAEGQSMNKNTTREGVVFKSLKSGFSFKAVANSYLLKKG